MVVFGSYEVLETVAVGSTGTVYRARHREIGRLAAIKELSRQLLAVPGLLERFRAEAQTLASLDDEHVVAVFDFVEEPARVWIAEEWVDGVTVAALLASSGRLSAEQSLGVLRGALLGLAHAHERDLVHRDFAPANILADRGGTSKLVDFGLAAPVGGTGVCGTPAFMSPEACRGAAVGKASDVYSAAAVLFHLLSGRVPFPAPTADAVLQAHLAQAPPALAGHGPALGELVAQSMAKDPAARPADARAFLDRLEYAAGKRYGPDWLARSSIAGLVTAAGTGAAVLAAGSAGTAAGTAASTAATVFTDAATTTGTAATAATGTAATAATGTATRRLSRLPRRWIGAAAAAVVLAIAIPVTAIALRGGSSHKTVTKHTTVVGPVSEAAARCISGTWIAAAGAYDDVWDGTPVLVHNPAGSNASFVRFSPDGTFFSVDPAGEPPAVGTLRGAQFIDVSYGVVTGRWRASGDHTLTEFAIDRRHSATTLYAGYAHTTSPGTPLQTGSIALATTCSAETLVIDNDFVYRGKKLTSHSTLRRTPSGPTAPPASAIPDQSALLGGINLNAYCTSPQVRAIRALTTKPLLGPGDAANNWACQHGVATTPIDMTAACQWAYPVEQNVAARAIDPNSAASWFCYGGPPATFTISPAAGGVGTIITASATSPCPPSTVGLTVELVPARGQSAITAGLTRPLPGGGRWKVTLQVGSLSGTVPLVIADGTVQIEAFCLLPHNLYMTYQTRPFQFRGRH
ncbi:MAG: hypothetical protein DLM57_05130 [Pseudonocardiales bacterium]|nr:MAG: hypothetical protein DLM57_05130 [Pseudonocardiales bacterium]